MSDHRRSSSRQRGTVPILPIYAQFGLSISFLGHFPRGLTFFFRDQGPPPTLGPGSAFRTPLDEMYILEPHPEVKDKKKCTHIGNKMTAKGDKTAVPLHGAIGGGAIEPTCCNVRAMTPGLAQRLVRVRGIFVIDVRSGCVLPVLDDVNISKIWMRVANALHKCGKCWQRVLHTHA